MYYSVKLISTYFTLKRKEHQITMYEMLLELHGLFTNLVFLVFY